MDRKVIMLIDCHTQLQHSLDITEAVEAWPADATRTTQAIGQWVLEYLKKNSDLAHDNDMKMCMHFLAGTKDDGLGDVNTAMEDLIQNVQRGHS